jgi:hypothetical protein
MNPNHKDRGVPVDPKRALDEALDRAARAAEQALDRSEPLGIWLQPLNDDLEPLDTLRLPAHKIPSNPADRRWMMECIAPEALSGAAGYVIVAEGVGASKDNGDVIIMHAETRAGDARTRVYPIIWSDSVAPRLAPPEEGPASSQGTFSRLLQVADAFQGCVDDTLLQSALAAQAGVIEELGDGDILMFAVGEQLVEVIGANHRVRLCTKLRLKNIKAAAAAGNVDAQRSYFELTAGCGILIHLNTDGSSTIRFAVDTVRSHTAIGRRSKDH